MYCPYQWYYEKTIGAKALRARHQARNAALGLTDTQAAHFNKGAAFHRAYDMTHGRGAMVKRVLAVVLMLIGLIACALIIAKQSDVNGLTLNAGWVAYVGNQ